MFTANLAQILGRAPQESGGAHALPRGLRRAWPSVLPLTAAALLGCSAAPTAPPAHTPTTTSGQPPIAFEGADWIPAGDETAYTYETRDLLSGETGLLVLRVRRVGGDAAEIVAPKKTTRLSYSALGVLRDAEGTYMLRTPVKEGTTWPAGPNVSASVGRVGFAVETKAGSFPVCVEVIQRRSGAVAGTVTNVYCKGVGLVSIEAKTTSEPPEHAQISLVKVERAMHIGPDGLTKVPAQ